MIEPPLLTCSRLCVGYGKKAILPAIDVEIRAGDFWAVIGRNGAGKTTWLRTLLGLLEPMGGKVERGDDVTLAYLAQRNRMDEIYPLLAREVVAMANLEKRAFFTRARPNAPSVVAALERAGVAELAELPFRRLSEGQKQKILLARVALSQAKLAVLDEPTSAMDEVAEHEAFALIDAMRKERGVAVLVVCHYLGAARRFANRAILLDRDAQSVVIGTPEDVFSHRSFRERYGEVAVS